MKRLLFALVLAVPVLTACTEAERKAVVNDVGVVAGAPADAKPGAVAVEVGKDLLEKADDPAAQINYLLQLALAAATGFAGRHFGPRVLSKKKDEVDAR